MKYRNVLRALVLGLALLALATLPQSASASVMGHLVVGTCGAGDVAVTATSINWTPDVSGFVSCLLVSGGTNVTSVGDGNLIAPPVFAGTATINDLTVPTSGGEAGFMSFVGSGVNMHFDLTGLGPGSGVLCTSGMANGDSCSAFAGSPFLLTKNGTSTSVSLHANGTIADTVGPLSFWSGAFTTQINNESPLQIEAIINSGGTIRSSFSGEFDVTVPEPVSLLLIGGGLMALAVIKRRKRV
jgi:hypothetical protein